MLVFKGVGKLKALHLRKLRIPLILIKKNYRKINLLKQINPETVQQLSIKNGLDGFVRAIWKTSINYV